jgi:phage shock protein C
MLCSYCQREIADGSNYCNFCGTQQRSNVPRKRLYRSATDCKIAGICGGVAAYLNVDSTFIRLIWAVITVIPGMIVGGIVAYLLAWIIIPREPRHKPAQTPVAHDSESG